MVTNTLGCIFVGLMIVLVVFLVYSLICLGVLLHGETACHDLGYDGAVTDGLTPRVLCYIDPREYVPLDSIDEAIKAVTTE